ncbi:MAG: TIGR04024 family LLM class F420-dependent oxidoreductase [Halanaeroarchaeum sp.]
MSIPLAVDTSLSVSAQPSIDTLVEQARWAEDAGLEHIWLPETWGRNVVTTLTMIADRTSSIGIGASILNVYSRSPALLGQTAVSLQEVSDGRFRLGVGPSGPAVIERWHGIPFEDPLKQTRETVEIVTKVISGDVVDYDGDRYQLSGFRLRSTPPSPAPPVDVASMGPKATELAGRFADGWQGLFLTPSGVRSRVDDIRRGAALGNRNPDSVRTMLSLTTAALPDGDRARELVRRHLAFYIGGMGTFYRDSLARQGYKERAHAIHDAWQAGDREKATDLLDEELLDRLGLAGTPERVREGLRDRWAIDGLDAVAISLPRGIEPAEVEATFKAIEPIV